MDWKATFLILTVVLSIANAHRLSGTVTPTHYKLQLNLPESAFTATNDAYTGEVTISATATQATTNITLHAAHDFIKIQQITVQNNEIPSESYTQNTTTDILTITLPSEVAVNTTLEIYIKFESKLSTADMYGFYKSSYVDNQVTKYLATTQFQPTYARRAFPCFDEPEYKATFNISISHPKNLNALSNQLGTVDTTLENDAAQTTVVFNTTTKMSSYLIAFVVSEFTCTSGGNIETELIPYQVCSRNDTSDTRSFAVDIGPKLLQSLNSYTGFLYSDMGMNKMDQVAIPDFAAGAMENWGLVTYREALLLWDSEESTNIDQENIATIISHEFAHMWFGNLVTNKWWAELFLNEGFATYFQYFTTHDVLPAWQLDKQFVLSVLHRALDADALSTSHALQHSVNTAAEVMSRFNAISYQKGGSIFRMVEHILGTENFKKGLQSYLKKYAHNNTLPENLWDALESSLDTTTAVELPTTLSIIMENWVKNPGFPVVHVSHAGASINIQQLERFLLSGSDNTSKWYVPLSYILSTDDESQIASTSPRDWLEPVGVVTLDAVDWIVLNNQASGFYRVQYNDGLRTRIGAALNTTTFSNIPELTRSQLVDDAFAFARTNKYNYSSVFSFLDFLKNDASIYPWSPALSGFNTVLRRVGYDSRLGNAIKAHLLELMETISASVPFRTLNESDHAYTMKQTTVLTTACRVGQEACVNQALERFGEFRINPEKRPPKNLRSVIYCNALRYNTDTPEEDWHLLWDTYTTTELASEKVRILNALGCTKDETLLRRFLNISLNPTSGIRPQDAMNVFTTVYSSNVIGVDIAFEFLRENHKLIAERYTSLNALPNLIRGLADRFTTEQQVEELRWFIQLGNLEDDFKLASEQALATAESNMKWLSENREELYAYYELSLEDEEIPAQNGTETNSTTQGTTTTTDRGGAESTTLSNFIILFSVLLAFITSKLTL